MMTKDEYVGWSAQQDSKNCNTCVHYDMKAMTCAAFPIGIPMPLVLGMEQHDKPLQGDNGIQFERIGDVEGLKRLKEFLTP